MPFALLIIGVVLVTSGVRNTQDNLFNLVKGDFTGQNNFIFWFASILIIGAIGYVKPLKPISTAFLTLLVLVLFLSKGNPSGVGGGFFQQFTSALGSTSNSTVGSNAGTSTASTPNLQSVNQNISNLQSQLAANLSQTEQGLLQDFSQTPTIGQ